MQLDDLAEILTSRSYIDGPPGQEVRLGPWSLSQCLTVVQGGRFRLLDLPVEMWTHICQLAISRPEPIKVFNKLCPRLNAAAVAQPPITRTCKLIRAETLPLFYEKHIFLVHRQNSMPRQLCAWLLAIGPTNRAHLRHLYSMSTSSSLTEHIEQQFDWEDSASPTLTALTAQELGTGVPMLHITFPPEAAKVEEDYMTRVRREAYEEWSNDTRPACPSLIGFKY